MANDDAVFGNDHHHHDDDDNDDDKETIDSPRTRPTAFVRGTPVRDAPSSPWTDPEESVSPSEIVHGNDASWIRNADRFSSDDKTKGGGGGVTRDSLNDSLRRRRSRRRPHPTNGDEGADKNGKSDSASLEAMNNAFSSWLKNDANAESSTDRAERRSSVETTRAAPNANIDVDANGEEKRPSSHHRDNSDSLEAKNTGFLSMLKNQANAESSSPKNKKPITAETSEGNEKHDAGAEEEVSGLSSRRHRHRREPSESLEEANTVFSSLLRQANADSSTDDAERCSSVETKTPPDLVEKSEALEETNSSPHRRTNCESLEARNNDFLSLLKNQANAESLTKDPHVGESRSNAPNVSDEGEVETKENTSSPHRRKHSTSLEAMNTDFMSLLTRATTESSSPKDAKLITAETLEGNVAPDVVVVDATSETGAKRDGSSSHR